MPLHPVFVRMPIFPGSNILCMKHRVFLPVLLMASFTAFGQINKIDPEKIKADPSYYWGESTGSGLKETEDRALADLVKQIAVKVSADFTHIVEERGKKIEEQSTSLVNSYASATLRDVQTFKKPVKEGFYVFQYIKKLEVTRIFDEREALVSDIFRRAEAYENELNSGYALKWYYNDLLLINSIPKAGITVDGVNLTAEIPVRINRLIGDIAFELVSDEKTSETERDIVVRVTSKGKPVQRLTFSFWDGSDEIQVQVTDGLAQIKLFGGSVTMTELRCNVIYSFYSQREEIKELAEIWDVVNKPSFGEPKVVKLKSLKPERPKQAGTLNAGSLTEPYRGKTKLVETAIKNLFVPGTAVAGDVQFQSKWASIQKYNRTGYSALQQEWVGGQTWDGAEVREVTVLNEYKSISLQTREYLIPEFDEKGTLTDINYGVMDGLYETVKEQGEHAGDWKERQVLLKFLEKYRTAFMTRDLETLNLIFADDAVIIVGRKLRPGENTSQFNYEPEGPAQPGIAYLKQTKTEYLQRQQKLFGDRKDIYLGYNSFQIMRKNNQPGVYGISMRQNYQSDGYADEGYLFLLIDFNGKAPQIYVRAWQPQEWREEALISMGNFRVYK